MIAWCRLTPHDNDGPKVLMTTGRKQVDIYAAMAEAAETVVHTGSTAASQLVAHKCVPRCLQRPAAWRAACWACARRWRFLKLLLVLQPALSVCCPHRLLLVDVCARSGLCFSRCFFVSRPHRLILWMHVRALGYSTSFPKRSTRYAGTERMLGRRQPAWPPCRSL